METKVIPQEDLEKAFQINSVYLGESRTDFFSWQKSYPNLFVGAYDKNELIGICYGHYKSRNKRVNLQGIATIEKFWRKGVGSILIQFFEKQVEDSGFLLIDLGCADDEKTERFYLKNGFNPIELVAKTKDHSELQRIKIVDYRTGKIKQQELRKKYNPEEVIFIFEKKLS
jgi:GNAT superfamily N-acetyltransferase